MMVMNMIMAGYFDIENTDLNTVILCYSGGGWPCDAPKVRFKCVSFDFGLIILTDY